MRSASSATARRTSPAAVARADAVDALVFGAEDFAASVGATRTPDGEEVSYARQRVLAEGE